MGYTPKEYRVSDMLKDAEYNVDFKEDEVYFWKTPRGEGYGTVKDMVETCGLYDKYEFECKNCHIITMKQGVSILNTGLLCQDCAKTVNYVNSWSKNYPFFEKMYDSEKNAIPLEKLRRDDNNVFWFTCEKRHSFSSKIGRVIHSTTGFHGCPVCLKGRKLRTFSVSVKLPRVAELWDYSKNADKPEEVSAGHQGYYNFICPKGHSFSSTLNHMRRSMNSKFRGCTVCAGKDDGEERFVSNVYPWVKDYWDEDKNTIPFEKVRLYSPTPRWFICDKGHSFCTKVESVYTSKSRFKGCPICSGAVLITGVNDFKTLYPEKAKFWAYEHNSLNPEEVLPHSRSVFLWHCSKCSELLRRDVDSVTNGQCICHSCLNVLSVSSSESEIGDYLESLGIRVERQMYIGKYSYDLFLPDYKLAIEYNGLYFHSNANKSDFRKINPLKYQLLKERGFNLYVIWEDDWKRDKDLCLRGLLSKIGLLTQEKVNARDCSIMYNFYPEGFLSKYHIQGEVGFANRYNCLQNKDGKVVAVLAYKVEGHCLDITRYATSCSVRGGFSKLLKGLLSQYEGLVDSVYTFSDNSISEGNLYKQCGFIKVADLKPDYTYLYKGKRVHKFNFRLKRFRDDTSLQYIDGLSESELAALNNIYKVYDYGKVKWQLVVEK